MLELENRMKLLLTAIILACGLAPSFARGDVNSELTVQNVLAGVAGGLMAPAGIAWGLRD